MLSHLFNVALYQPLYNGFIGLIAAFPWLDAGVVVILFTVLIKLVLFPLSQKSVRSQLEIKRLQPEIDDLKLKLKDNKQEQALRTMKLYKERGVNPFSGVVLALIQLPILIALYMVFYRGGLDVIHTETLYSFIKVPAQIDKMFLGLIDITTKSTVMAVLVAVGQFFQIRFTMPPKPAAKSDEKKTLSVQDELSKNMSFQMKYIMPVFMFFVARSLPSLVSLYLITSSVFAVGQEIYTKKKINNTN